MIKKLICDCYIKLMFFAVRKLEKRGVYYYIYFDMGPQDKEPFNLFCIFNKKSKGGYFHA